MDLTYKIETVADVAKLEQLYDANIKAIDSLKAAGDLTAEQDAKLRDLQRTVSSIADTFRRFNETLANPPQEYLAFLEKVKNADFASMTVRGLDTPKLPTVAATPPPMPPTVLDRAEYEARLEKSGAGHPPTGEQSKAVAMSIENDVRAAIAGGMEAVLVQIANGVEKRMALATDGSRIKDERGMTFFGGSVFGADQRVEIGPKEPPKADPERVRAAELAVEALEAEAQETRELYDEEAKLAEADGNAAKAAKMRAEGANQLSATLAKLADAERELVAARQGAAAAPAGPPASRKDDVGDSPPPPSPPPPPPSPPPPPPEPPKGPPPPPKGPPMTSGEFRRLKTEADELEAAIESLEESGATVGAELDARLDYLAAKLNSGSAAAARQIVALEDSAVKNDLIEKEIAALRNKTGEAQQVSGEAQNFPQAPSYKVVSGEAQEFPQAPLNPVAYEIVTPEQYDLLVKARDAAAAYLKTLTDESAIADAQRQLDAMNDSLARSEPRAQEAADAYLKMREALDELANSGVAASEAGANITNQEQLQATQRLLEIEKQRLAEQRIGTEAYAAHKARVDELTAAVNGENAELVRNLELLKQEAVALKQAGDEAGLAANKRNQTAIKGALGQPSGLLDGVKEKGEELFRAYKQGGGGVEGFIGVLKAGGGAMAGWAAGIGLLGLAVKKAHDEFEQAQVAVTKLDAALAQNGNLNDENRKKLHALASQLEAATGIADEKWLVAQKKLMQFGADTSNMDKYTDAVKNLAGIMDGDIESAATAVSRAMQGQFGMFARYGIYVDEAGTKTEKLEKLFEQLAQRGGGQLEAFGETVQGQKARLGNSLSNFWEGLGNAMGPSRWRGELAKVMDSINENFTKAIPVVDGLKNSMSTLSPEAKTAADALNDLTKADVGEMGGVKKKADEATAALGQEISALRRLQGELDQRGDEELKTKLAEIDLAEARANPKTAAEKDKFEQQRRDARRDAEGRKIGRSESTAVMERDLASTAYQSAAEKSEDFRKKSDAELKKLEQARADALAKSGVGEDSTGAERLAKFKELEAAKKAAEDEVAKTQRVEFPTDQEGRLIGEGKTIDTEATAEKKKLLAAIEEQMAAIKRLASTEAALAKGRKDVTEYEKTVIAPALLDAANKLREADNAAAKAAAQRKTFTVSGQTEDITAKRKLAEANAEQKAEEAITAAKQKKADIEAKLSADAETKKRGGAGLSDGAKAGLQHELRQAEFDKKLAELLKAELAVRDDPEKSRLARTEVQNALQLQRNLNLDPRLGPALAIPSAQPIAVRPAAEKPPEPVDPRQAAIDKAKADADAVAKRELAAASAKSEAERRAKLQADREAAAIAAHNRSAGPDDQWSDTHFADKRAAEANRLADQKAEREAERARRKAGTGGQPQAAVDNGPATEIVAEAGATQVAAITELGEAMVEAMTETTAELQKQKAAIGILRQQLRNNQV
jgi:hypothetical protein